MLKKTIMWLLFVNGASALAADCDNFLNFSGDVDATRAEFQKQPQQMSWQWFRCLNQPVNANAREWEMLKPTSQVYLSDGAKPLPYAQRTVTPAEVITQATTLGMDTSKVFHDLDAKLQVDGLPLEMGGASPPATTAQFVRYQLLMNAGTFDYVVKQAVYNVNGQEALTSALDFPANAWELKTSWLWVGNNQTYLRLLIKDKYEIANGYYKDSDGTYKVGYVALSGMHIINKLFEEWVWITFENRNNPKYTITNGFPATPMVNTTGPTAAAKVQNAIFQQANPTLSEYELIGVQWGFGKGPQLLASSQMESAFQSRSSCIACHQTAAYSADDGYYNFAHKENGGILYPIEETPTSAFTNYNMLDFVWSLKRASWSR
ncbi:MAG: hypothetical protein ACI8WB_004232 [Phenylobacterium sp.]|jgi:hypothetical protein